VGRAFATPPELAAISDRLEKLDEGMRRRDEKAAELDVASEEAVRELEGLVAEGEQAAAEVAGIQAAVVELERRQGAAAHDTVVIVRVMMVFIWVVGLLLLGLRSDVWLPPERFTFLTKRAPIVAYDLGQSNGDWISLLGDKRRLLVRVRVSDVASREFCRKERPARTRTFVQLFTGGPSGPDYPLCYPPHRTK
jgi:hypothetical protein